MNRSHSELMQVANYGMGGHYTPHYDYLIVDRPPEERHLVGEQERLAGDRTATLMFYVSADTIKQFAYPLIVIVVTILEVA